MQFTVVDIKESSKYVTFIFCNDDTIQLTVKARNASMFQPYGVYEISVTHGMLITSRVPFHNDVQDVNTTTLLGVVTRKTRNSLHISAGHTQWVFPRRVCYLNPGTDVCITSKKNITCSK